MVLALVIGAISGNGDSGTKAGSSSGPLPALSVAPPPNVDAQAASCTKVLEALPVALAKLKPRVVHTDPSTPYVVAWGDPAIILSCGAARPKDLVPGSDVQDFAAGSLAGPYYDVTKSGDANVYTTVDRAAYVAITIPGKYQAANYLPTLTTAIAKALPPVCSTLTTEPDPDKLCTRRP